MDKRTRTRLQTDFKILTDYIKFMLLHEHQQQAETIGMSFDKFKNIRRRLSTPDESDIRKLLDYYEVEMKNAKDWADPTKSANDDKTRALYVKIAELEERNQELEEKYIAVLERQLNDKSPNRKKKP